MCTCVVNDIRTIECIHCICSIYSTCIITQKDVLIHVTIHYTECPVPVLKWCLAMFSNS